MPKIMGESLADHRALTRERLFDALGSLLAEQSFDTITMSAIASRAGIGRTAVYNHFEDKEVLLLAYMNEATKDFAHRLRDLIDTEPDPIERLRSYVRVHLEMTDRFHLASRLRLHEQMSEENSSHLHEHAETVGRALLTILVDAMTSGAIPRQDPHLLVSLIHGSLAGQRLPSAPAERTARIAHIQDYILRAVGVAPSRPHAPRPRPEAGAHERRATASPDRALEPAARDAGRAKDRPLDPSEHSAAFMRCPVAY